MTNTLLVPCGGKSSRFPNMKPKYLLTHPDGKLMIEKSIEMLNLDVFDRIIITLIKEHTEKYEAKLILEQVFKDNKKIEFCVLDDFTKSASETVALSIEKMNIKGSFVIKDCDNVVKTIIPQNIENAILGYDLHKHPDITNVPGKSFLKINEQNIIQDIIEKKIVSNIICLGTYIFANVDDFMFAYKTLLNKKVDGEMFVSHLVSYLLSSGNVFKYIEALDYEDWGTFNEWNQMQKDYSTYFIDIDGVLLKNCGKYGKTNWSNNKEILKENIESIVNLQKNGAQIVITTSRTEQYRKNLEAILKENGLIPYQIVMGLNHARRVLINDFANTNPYPSAIAITLPRNAELKEYLK